MRRWILGWLAALVLAGTCCMGSVPAQGTTDLQRGYQAAPGAGAEDGPGRTPAFPYAVAAIITLLILVIVCTPSRKLPA